MKICAITQRVDQVCGRNEVRDSLDQRLAGWVLRQGLLPFPVPNRIPSRATLWVWLRRLRPACLVLSGGNDWGEFPERDRTEFRLLEWAKSRRIKVLGICRGMQVMARFAGSGLERIEKHCRTIHQLKGGGVVNSYHRWAVKSCPRGYRVIHQSEDDCLEQIQHNKVPWTGVMWHPERPGNRGVKISL